MKLPTKLKKVGVWFAVAISAVMLVFAWALSSAPGGSPDEPAHFVSIYCFSKKYKSSCEEQGENIYNLNPVKNISACYLYQRDRGAACEVSNFFDSLTLNSEVIHRPFTENQYYKILSLFASDYYILSLLTMRIFNGFTFLLIVLISYLLFPKSLREYFLFSTLAISIPLGIYIVTSINTSAWLITGLIGVWASFYSILFDIKTLKNHLIIFISRLVLLIISIFIAISSRFDGIYFVIITLLSILLIFASQNLMNVFQRFLPSNTFKILFFSSMLTFALILLTYFQDRAKVAGSSDNFLNPDRIFENISRLPHLLLGPFGTWGLGWLDVWLSPITYLLTAVVALGITFLSFRAIDFSHFVAIVIFGLSVVLLPLIVLQSSDYLVGEWVQPRYLLPLYFPLFGLMFISLALNRSYLSKIQSATALILISIAHSFALFANLERYIRGQNTVSPNLNINLVWWWDQLISPNLVWLFGSISLGFLSLVTYKKMYTKSSVGPEGLEPPTPAL